MIPVRDVIPSRTTPGVTITIIAVSVCVWLLTVVLDVEQPIASALGPSSVAYLVINGLLLWIFGETVEDQLGHLRFLTLYLVCAVLSASANFISPVIPIVDITSGALAGVLGAYFVMFPRSRILVLVPVPITVVEVPAFLFLGFWFLLQLLANLRTDVGSVMFFWLVQRPAIQILLFAIGVLLCLALRRPERARVEWWSP